MSAEPFCKDCIHCIAPRRLFGLREPIWHDAKCANSIPRWTDKVSGKARAGDPDKCVWERAGGILRKPGGCGPEAIHFSPKNTAQEAGL